MTCTDTGKRRKGEPWRARYLSANLTLQTPQFHLIAPPEARAQMGLATEVMLDSLYRRVYSLRETLNLKLLKD